MDPLYTDYAGLYRLATCVAPALSVFFAVGVYLQPLLRYSTTTKSRIIYESSIGEIAVCKGVGMRCGIVSHFTGLPYHMQHLLMVVNSLNDLFYVSNIVV